MKHDELRDWIIWQISDEVFDAAGIIKSEQIALADSILNKIAKEAEDVCKKSTEYYPASDTAYGVNIGIERVQKAIRQRLMGDE